MRSIKDIREKITSVEGLVIGRWYILYGSNDNDRRILFKYRHHDGDNVYDCKCYIYCGNRYYYNDNSITFRFDNSEYYCREAKDSEVLEYFDVI